MLADCLLIVFISICTAFLGEGNIFSYRFIHEIVETAVLFRLFLVILSISYVSHIFATSLSKPLFKNTIDRRFQEIHGISKTRSLPSDHIYNNCGFQYTGGQLCKYR